MAGREKPPPSGVSEIIGKVVRQVPAPSPDDRARHEEERIRAAAKREDRYQSAVHWVTVLGVWAVGLTIVVVLIIRTAHLVMPTPWRWLDDAQLRLIDQFLFSGTVGGVLTQGVHRLQRRSGRRR